MSELQQLKDEACKAIEENGHRIISLAKDIQDNPELGFKEERTSAKIAGALKELGLGVKKSLAKTGLKTKISGSKEAKVETNIAVLGELDALVNSDHPESAPQTGAVHACGHHAQLANLIGVAYGFATTNVIEHLSGSISIMAVPAEEFIDLEYRKKLIQQGEIEYFSGKQELIRNGHFEDIDAALIVHADNSPERTVRSRISMNGFLGKFVQFQGRSAHAGAEPEKGVNALNAANIGLEAINARRETFLEKDVVRVHPIITKGGEEVNVIPSDVRMETYVRAKTVDAMLRANEKVDQALKGGALSLGADVKISDYPGYLPFESSNVLANVFDKNAEMILGSDSVNEKCPHVTASTDMGDVAQLVPAIEPSIGGFEGALHSKDFKVVDEEMAFVIPSMITACSLIDILTDEKRIDDVLGEREEKRGEKDYLNTLARMKSESTTKFME
ncbi:MAG: amidohydrolase [Candidatus Bipolaricaulota bacterium]|nr:amidohydrolase [Candidatus Bipolaricaulota bacterium]